MIIMIFVAAVIWGVTNPLLKHYSQGINTATTGAGQKQAHQSTSWLGGVTSEVAFLLQRPKYLLCQAINLSGSVAFFYALQSVDISLGSIVTNALAFVITVLVSSLFMDEGPLSARCWAGVVCVLVGVSLCTYSKA